MSVASDGSSSRRWSRPPRWTAVPPRSSASSRASACTRATAGCARHVRRTSTAPPSTRSRTSRLSLGSRPSKSWCRSIMSSCRRPLTFPRSPSCVCPAASPTSWSSGAGTDRSCNSWIRPAGGGGPRVAGFSVSCTSMKPPCRRRRGATGPRATKRSPSSRVGWRMMEFVVLRSTAFFSERKRRRAGVCSLQRMPQGASRARSCDPAASDGARKEPGSSSGCTPARSSRRPASSRWSPDVTGPFDRRQRATRMRNRCWYAAPYW